MMLNKKSSRMSAWKALYVIPLVGISLAATAETKVDYQYEDQQPEAVADTPDDKDSKKSFKEKNMSEGRFIVDEEAGTVTMIYFDHEGNEMRACHVGLDLSQDRYFVNGNMSTPKAFEMRMEEDDAVLLSAYLKSGKKIRGVVLPNNNYATGTWDASKHPDEQDAVYHKDGKVYKIQGGKYVEIEAPKIKVRDANGNEVKVSESNLVYVINGERMPDGFDLNTIDPATITSMEVLKTEKALQEYGTDKGVIVITTGPTKANEEKPAPDIYIDGKKATSEEIAALPANPKGTISADGTVWITTEDETVEKPNPDEVVYVVTDKAAELIQNRDPQFQGGGMPEFQKWVHEHIKYPEGVTSEGRVDVSFRITEDGEIADVKVLRGADAKLNEEAIRVIESSGNGWVPAIKDGKKISITMMVPVIFKK